MAKIPTDGMPPFLFYMAGNTVWSFFSNSLSSVSNTFSVNAAIFGKVYFPRLCMPIAYLLSQLIAFTIRFGVFLAFLLYFLLAGSDVRPNIWMLILPALLLLTGGISMSLGLVISALTTKYRDLQHFLAIGLQLLMYATPIIYPFSTVEGIWRWILLANPMTPIIEAFRQAFLGASSLGPEYLLYSSGFTTVTLLISLVIFNRAESTFVDTI
jgi:lipopolysaccharide transport system permease protein